MGWSGSEKACKNHPYHDQRQGICPSCLRERLSQLVLVTSQYHKDSVATMVRSCSSSMSSSSPSSSSNPHWSAAALNRIGSQVIGSISFKVSVGNDRRLKKSRSIDFVSSSLAGEVNHGKKKTGFWSKLLHLKGKKGRLDGFSDYGKKGVLNN